MLIFWPILLFSNAQKIPNNAPEVHLQFAHYAQVEPTTDVRHEETQLHYHRVQPFQFYTCSDSKVGTS